MLHQNLPKLEHSIIVIVKIVGEGCRLDIQLPGQDHLLAGLEELEPAVGRVVDRPPGLPHLAQASSSDGQHRDWT